MNNPQPIRNVPKRLISFGSLTSRLSRDRSFVLLYHRVLPDEECCEAKANQALLVSKSNFEAHLKYLKEHFDVCTLSELVSDNERDKDSSIRRPRVAITFDDGWNDNYHHAWPLLKKYQIPATIFLITDFIQDGGTLWWSALEQHLASLQPTDVRTWTSGLIELAIENGFDDLAIELESIYQAKAIDSDLVINTFKDLSQDRLETFVTLLDIQSLSQQSRDLMTWDQAREMQGQFIEFGAHTQRHELLTKLKEQEIVSTIENSVQSLKDNGITPISVFSYPNGDNNLDVQRAVAVSGFEYAVTTRRATLKREHENNLDIPRINIGGGNNATVSVLRQRLARAYWIGEQPENSSANSPKTEDTQPKAVSAAKLTAWTLASRIAGIVIRLSRNILLARILGPQERGILNAIVAVIEMVVVLISFGLPMSASYHAAQSENKKSLAPTLGLMCTGIGALVAIIVYTLCNVPALFRGFGDQVAPFAFIAAATSMFFFLRLITHHYLVGSGRVTSSNWLRLIESGLPLLLFVIFILTWRQDLPAAVTSWAAGYAFVAIFSISIVWHFNNGFSKPSRDVAKSLFGFGVRSYWLGVFQILIFRSDLILLSILIGEEAVAFYAIAVVGAEMLLVFAEAGTTVATRSLLGGGDAEDPNVKKKLTQNIARWTLYMMLPVGFFLALTRDFWIWLAFGAEFLPASDALIWLIPGIVGLAVSGFIRLDLIGRGRPGWISIVLGVCAVTNISLNLLLIPHFNIVGAAIASSITYLFMTLIYCLLFRYETKAKLLEFLWNFEEDYHAFQSSRRYLIMRFKSLRSNA